MSVIENPNAVNPKAVLNQPPPLRGYNMYLANLPLVEAVQREGAGWIHEQCMEAGDDRDGELVELGRLANENPPVLRAIDRFGHRIDEVEFHPAWHQLMELAVGHGVHALPWREPRAGAHTARAAMMLAASGLESGHGCPISMTYAAIPVLRRQPELADEWEPRLTSLEYDARMIPADQKRGSLFGMAMTEKQGGSDVRANITRARPLNGGGAGAEYEITGHKWFCSAPMCDAFLVLAQADGGVSCFLLPRWTPDGERNAFHIQRLKDKLGDRSNASSEVEFDGAWARLVGEEGRGVPTIIEMVNYTRLDCVLGSAGLMRRAVAEATHHTAHRSAFGKPLIDQPLMQNVLADLCVESEAATITGMRLARACDEAPDDPQQNAFKRLGLAVSKYWVAKSAVWHVGEALECLGGNGYVEESPMPRLYREAPLNSIWEGSGNVNALDVLRAVGREPETAHRVLDGLLAQTRDLPGAAATVDSIRKTLQAPEAEASARQITERLYILAATAALSGTAPPEIVEAYAVSRLAAPARMIGANDLGQALEPLLDRAF